MVILLIIAAAFFAMQFLFNKKFKEDQGDTVSSVLLFLLLTNLGIFFIMFALNKFTLQFNWFTALWSCVAVVSGLTYTFFSFKAFNIVNLSVFSIVAMLGGMLLPFLQGIIFYNEPITPFKIISCVVIIAALALTFEKGKQSKMAILCYAAIFLLNGFSGVMLKIYQSSEYATGSENFMAVKSLFAAIVCLGWIFIKDRKLPEVKLKPFCYASLFSATCGLGNLFCLIALTKLDASMQYPLITGGTMVFTTIISLFLREKLTWKSFVSTGLALAATVLIIL